MSENLFVMGLLLALVVIGLGLALTLSLVTPVSPRRRQPSGDTATGAYIPIWFGGSVSDGGAGGGGHCPVDGGGGAGCDGGGVSH